MDRLLTPHESEELRQMRESIAEVKPRHDVKVLIEAAYEAPDWDWTDCDGCTLVSELHAPKGFRDPVCVMHDYTRWLARQKYEAVIEAGGSKHRAMKARDELVEWGDEMFLHGNLDFAVLYKNKLVRKIVVARAWIRWAGVRLAWKFYLGWLPNDVEQPNDGRWHKHCKCCR